VEFLQSLVQVDGAHIDGSSTKYLQGDRVLLRAHAQVDVPIRSQPAFGVESSDCPALDQQGLHAGRAKQRDGRDDVLFVARSLECVKTVGLS
jgi:hypothetical protein